MPVPRPRPAPARRRRARRPSTGRRRVVRHRDFSEYERAVEDLQDRPDAFGMVSRPAPPSARRPGGGSRRASAAAPRARARRAARTRRRRSACVPLRIASTKCSHSVRSGSSFGQPRAPDVARAGDVLAVGLGALVEALVVDGDLALERHVVERRHALRADDREAALLVRVQPREVQVGGQARTGSAGSRRRRPRRPRACSSRRAPGPRTAPRRPAAAGRRRRARRATTARSRRPAACRGSGGCRRRRGPGRGRRRR